MILHLLFAAFIASANSHHLEKRMINGDFASIYDFPYQVFIGDPSPLCSGAIIGKRHVLTAGHCVSDNPTKLTIRAGSDLRLEGGSIHHIIDVKIHTKFSVDNIRLTSRFDIAVVKVNESFVFDSTRQPIKLFQSKEKVQKDSTGQLAGWGWIEPRVFPKKLRKITVKVTDKSECNKTYSKYGGIIRGQFCAENCDKPKKQGYFGDSGCPLVIGGRLAGLLIYGGEDKLPEAPMVFSSVPYFHDWIKQRVGTYNLF